MNPGLRPGCGMLAAVKPMRYRQLDALVAITQNEPGLIRHGIWINFLKTGAA